MKFWFGLFLLVLGLFMGLYVGVYLMFFKGIVLVAASVSPIVPYGIAVGVVKIVFASFFGVVSGLCLVFPGIHLMLTSE